jgi:hypothetical protein
MGGFDKPLRFFQSIVKGKRSPSRGFDTKFAHEWLTAMMTGSDGNTFGIQYGGQVMRMRSINRKGKDRCFSGNRSMFLETWNIG